MSVRITWMDVDALDARQRRGDRVYLELNLIPDALDATARYEGTVRRHEDTYLLYRYASGDRRPVFGWITPWDELHRGLGVHGPVWYDTLEQGQSFPVVVDPADPLRHFIMGSPFDRMNRGGYYFCRR